jgi:hypothetical protein
MTDERAGEPLDEILFRAFESMLPLARVFSPDIPEAAAGVWLGCVQRVFDTRSFEDIQVLDHAAKLASLGFPEELIKTFAPFDPRRLPPSAADSDPVSWPWKAPYVAAARRITARLHEMIEPGPPDLTALGVIIAIENGCEGELRRLIAFGVEERPFNVVRDVMRKLFNFPRFKTESVTRFEDWKPPYGSDFDERLERIAWVKKPPSNIAPREGGPIPGDSDDDEFTPCTL